MIKIKTDPAAEVVSAADVRAFLHLTSTAYDTTLGNLSVAARQLAEHYTRRAFISQTWQRVLDESEMTETIKLPRPPLQSIVSVTYYDTANTVHTLDPAYYTYDTFSDPGWLVLNVGYSWPSTREYNAFVVEYISGYGAGPSNVPMAIRTAITEAAAYSFVNGKMGELPEDSKLKLQPYKVYI